MSRPHWPLVVPLLVAALFACEEPKTEPPPKVDHLDLGEAPAFTTVQGYVFDVEAFWFWVAKCGDGPCPPPLVVNGIPSLRSALVKNARVGLFDPAALKLIEYPDPTGDEGAWALHELPLREGPPLLAEAWPPPTGAEPTRNHLGPPYFEAPGARYVRTQSLRPIVPHSRLCIGMSAAILSENGILDAVARHLTREGRPTTVADLLDPTLHGGVVVTWLHVPGPPVLRAPASGSRLEASEGEMLTLAWAPPGALPPGDGDLPGAQSERGFYVWPEQGPSPLGLFALVLPPRAPGPPPAVTLRPIPPPIPGQPSWLFPKLPPMPIGPGASYLELQAQERGPAAPPPYWVCVPK